LAPSCRPRGSTRRAHRGDDRERDEHLDHREARAALRSEAARNAGVSGAAHRQHLVAAGAGADDRRAAGGRMQRHAHGVVDASVPNTTTARARRRNPG
jgi:hypothetical protein